MLHTHQILPRVNFSFSQNLKSSLKGTYFQSSEDIPKKTVELLKAL
jgi:hypothetical protein